LLWSLVTFTEPCAAGTTDDIEKVIFLAHDVEKATISVIKTPNETFLAV
jgi:hypothetical protein